MKISKKERKAEIDFDSLVKDLIAEHGMIYFADYDGQVFIYKPLNRKDYREIVENENLTSFEKEDEVCEKTILWPSNVDFDEIDAGIPTKLYREILANSCLDDIESVVNLIDVFREELTNVDTQMSCIISEAFPNYDIEEIEAWDMIKLCKIFCRAEWKLKNLRSMENLHDIRDVLNMFTGSNIEDEDSNEEIDEPVQQQKVPVQSNNNQKTIKVGNKEMTADEYRQYEEFKRMYPEISFESDTMFTGFETMSADTLTPGLRTR